MIENATLPFEALTKGYILVPKALISIILNQMEEEFSYVDAFLMILTKVNYMEAIATYRGHKILCKRGESIITIDGWARLFHWSRGKTRYFFTKLEQRNMISITPTEYQINQIQVVDYDKWTGKSVMGHEKKKTRTEEEFEQFWSEYHEKTQLRKVDIGTARREWQKLSQKERNLAIEKIDSYCEFIGNRMYCKNAFNYLKAKSFYDEDV